MELSGGFYEPPRAGTPLSSAIPATSGNPPQPITTNTLTATSTSSTSAVDTGATATSTDGDATAAGAAQLQDSTAISGPGMQPATLPDPTSPTLNLDQELASVVKGLGSFWGSIRKQSVSAFHAAEKQAEQYATTARKDLTPLVSKARANLDDFQKTAKEELARLSETGVSQSGSVDANGTPVTVMIGADGNPVVVDTVPIKVDKGKGVDRSEKVGEGDIAGGEATQTPAAAASAFFAKMQSQIASNPNVGGLQKNLQRSLATAQSNLATLPGSLQSNLTQLQAQLPHIVDGKTAENYLHKGENWFNEFSGELGRLAKDAVRVVPPSEAEMSSARTKKREERLRKADQVAIGRKDTLLYRLRSDSALLLLDPAKPSTFAAPTAPGAAGPEEPATPSSPAADSREAFSKFLQAIEDRGGLEGESFKAQVASENDEGLRKMLGELVPSQLTAEAFWTRYFFRKSQIEEDERKRREVLEGAIKTEEEEEFSWDMEEEDDDDTPGVSNAVSASATLATSTASLPPSTIATADASDTKPHSSSASATAGSAIPRSQTPLRESSTSSDKASSDDKDDKKSPRVSSDGASSYDVVGALSGTPSEGEPETIEPMSKLTEAPVAVPFAASAAPPAKTAAPAPESDEDSDWE